MVVITAVSLIFIAAAILAVFTAGPVMLLWGAIAGTYGLPTMGLGTSVQVCLLAGILLSLGNSSASNK